MAQSKKSKAKMIAKLNAKLSAGAKPRFPADRHEIKTVALDKIQASLKEQGAVHPSQLPQFEPQLQFIISNRYYEVAALKAMEKARATAAFICETGMGGWSLELQYSSDDVIGEVAKAYDDACDEMGLE